MAEVPITSSGRSGLLKIVLANGCFDLLHSGHIEHLVEAKKMGDFLFVGLTEDEYVNKPGRPIVSWEDRAAVLRGLRCVTAVIACKSGADAIRDVKPQIFVKGEDYSGIGITEDEKNAMNEVGCEVRYTTTEKKSTTEIIAKILEDNRKRQERMTMWNETSRSLPPKGEVLAVRWKLKNYTHLMGIVDELATWDGNEWTKVDPDLTMTNTKREKGEYYLWRRMET